MPIFRPLLFPLSDMCIQTLDGNLGFDEFFINKNKQFSFDLWFVYCEFLFIIGSNTESAWNFNSDNIISEDSVYPTRGREDRGASRTPSPEIGFMLGSATAR